MSKAPVIVSTDWLHERIYTDKHKDEKIRILDATWYSDRDAMKDYAKGHIQGAVYFNAFQGVELTPVHPRKLADAETFQMNARGSGVDNDSHVIVYDGCEGRNGFFMAPRVWLMFKIYGHDKVSVLDGGLAKWLADGYEATDMCMKIAEGNFVAKCCSKEWLRTYEDMVKGVTDKAAQPVCDTRPTSLYQGNRNDPRSGHYPGAVNLPATSIVSPETLCLKDINAIKKVFNEAGIDLSKPTTFMCSSGMSSCSVAMAAHICDCPQVTVYLEGFTEWSLKAEPHLIENTQC